MRVAEVDGKKNNISRKDVNLHVIAAKRQARFVKIVKDQNLSSSIGIERTFRLHLFTASYPLSLNLDQKKLVKKCTVQHELIARSGVLPAFTASARARSASFARARMR